MNKIQKTHNTIFQFLTYPAFIYIDIVAAILNIGCFFNKKWPKSAVHVDDVYKERK